MDGLDLAVSFSCVLRAFQLTATASIYNGLTGVGLFVFYHPHNHTRAEGFSYRTILAKIDYLGGILSITGLTLL